MSNNQTSYSNQTSYLDQTEAASLYMHVKRLHTVQPVCVFIHFNLHQIFVFFHQNEKRKEANGSAVILRVDVTKNNIFRSNPFASSFGEFLFVEADQT